MDGVAPDDVRRLRDLDPRQLGRPGEERVAADLDSRGDDPAEVLPLRGHAVERRRRAEVDDDDRPLRPLVCRDRIDDAVGADLPGVLVEDGHPGTDAGADDEGLGVERTAHEIRHGLGERWDDARDRRRDDVARPEVVHCE